MAMPTSGSLGIKTCPNSVPCTSIAQVVDGNVVGNKSLSTLSTTAGKTAPHCMREFYGYSNAPTLCVNPTSATFSSGAGACNICVCASSSNSWSVVENETWISIVNGSGVGNGTFTISVLKNLTGNPRIATVCVTSSAPTAYVSVSQGAL